MFISTQAYHVHIRSTSHLQKVMELEKLKANPASSRSEMSAASTIAQSTVSTSTGLAKTSDDGKPMGENSSTGMDVARGPNYCHVCCFDFTNAEVGLILLVMI